MDTLSPSATRRVRAQHAEDLHRLADQAEHAGVRILLEPTEGAHFATDPANPTRVYRVGVERCTCRRFRVWGRCGHHALLLAELGLIPDAEEAAIDPEDEAALAA